MTGEGDQGSVGTRDGGAGFFRKWRDGMRVVVIVGDGVVRGVKEVFWVIRVSTDSGAGIFKVDDALEF